MQVSHSNKNNSAMHIIKQTLQQQVNPTSDSSSNWHRILAPMSSNTFLCLTYELSTNIHGCQPKLQRIECQMSTIILSKPQSIMGRTINIRLWKIFDVNSHK